MLAEKKVLLMGRVLKGKLNGLGVRIEEKFTNGWASEKKNPAQ